MKNKKLQRNLSYVFSFFAALSLCMILVLTGVRYTLMDQRYFMNQLNEVQYYAKTAETINYEINQQARGAGFAVDTFKDFIQEEDIRLPMIDYEQAILKGKDVSISLTSFQDKLKEKIETYQKANKLQITTGEKDALQLFQKECEKTYQHLTQFPYLPTFYQYMTAFQKFYVFALIFLMLSMITLFAMLNKLQDSKRRARRFSAYACLGCGLMLLVAPLYLYSSSFFEKINLEPMYLYQFIIANITNLLKLYIAAGIGMLLIGIFITYPRLKLNRKHTHHHKNWQSGSPLLMQIEKDDEA